MLLNTNEQALLSYLEEKRRATIAEMAEQIFPDLTPDKANSRVRNGLRRLRDKLDLVRKLERGTYEPVLPPVTEEKAPTLAELQGVVISAVKRTAAGLSDEEVADLVQAVNEKLLRKLPDYDKGRAALGTFVYTVARSTTLDALRSRQRQPVQLELTEQPTVGDDALAVLMRQEQEQLVREVINAMDETDRELALACMSDDFDLGAYAAQLGISRETLYVRKHRLMQKIASALRNQLDS